MSTVLYRATGTDDEFTIKVVHPDGSEMDLFDALEELESLMHRVTDSVYDVAVALDEATGGAEPAA